MNTLGSGHFVTRISLIEPMLEPEVISAGSSRIGQMEISKDGNWLYLGNADDKTIDRVEIATSRIDVIRQSTAQDSFYPGMKYAVN